MQVLSTMATGIGNTLKDSFSDSTSSGSMSARTSIPNSALQYYLMKQQREWSLEDTADQRAYNEELYEKYQSPKAQAAQYEQAGYSKLAALDGNGSWSINPVQSMNDSNTSGMASAMASMANNSSSISAQKSINTANILANSILQAEEIRGKKLDNDYKEKQYSADNAVYDTPVSKRDFPQLHGYDQDWFNDFSEKLGHQVTLRDMMAAGVAKQVVHSANAAAGHVHDWKSGAEYESVVGHMNDDEDYFSYDVDSHDGLVTTLLQMFTNSCTDSNNQTAMSQLRAEYEQFRKDNQAWITELEKEKNSKKMSDVDVEWQVAEKWLSAIGTGSEAFNNIFGNFNIGRILQGILSKSGPRNNYKPASNNISK